jgi:Zn-dependent metalloprotease
MKTFNRLSVVLLIVMLSNLAYANISHIKIFPGYKLNDSLGKLTDLETANLAVSNYLKSHEKEFNIKTEGLQLRYSFFSCGHYYLIYQQHHSGIPIYAGKVGVKVKTDGTIRKIGVRFYHSIPLSFPSATTRDNAINLAKNVFKDYSDEPVKVESSSMIIFPHDQEDRYSLCWRVDLSHLEADRAEAFYLDAGDGSLVFREETIRKSISGTVEGTIWPENYYDTWINKTVQSTVERPFVHETVNLDGTAYSDDTDGAGDWLINNGNPYDDIGSTLSGPYVTIHHTGGSIDEHFSDTEYSWTWDDMANHCDEYNVFYHVNLIHDYYLNNFGYQWDYSGDPAMDAYVYVNSTDAYYVGASIYFGTAVASGDPTQRFYARTSDVIYHEYTHAVKDDINANNNGAIDEGFSDYFACTIVGESLFGEGYHAGRPLDNNYLYPDDWVVSSPPQYTDNYYNGLIMSGAAWDLREALGASITDNVIFEGLCNLGISPYTQDFRNLIGCILEADDDAYGDSNPANGTPHQDDILDAFRGHHMYPSHYVFSGNLITTSGASNSNLD